MDLGDEEVAALVRSGYDAIAERYLRYAAGAHSHPRHEWLGRLLDVLRPGSRILELGCGPGVPTARDIAEAGHRLVGVDISPRQLDLARRSVPGATFIEADMLALELEPGSFDAVVALYSIIHVPRRHYPVLFERIHRWLTPEGWFLASLGTGDSAGWLEEDLLGFGAKNWTNSCDVTTTERLLHASGLVPEVVEIVDQGEPSGPERWLYVLARPEEHGAA
ncbi:MAG TPA: class I SAM-dependent methyltransferase [Acidimicrobiales bacterium]|nr:class I SAM-dependent methyltransferase [Acidimicrobiales bacterium]